MVAALARATRPHLVKALSLRAKYFGDVGYVTRQLHKIENILSSPQDYGRRRRLARLSELSLNGALAARLLGELKQNGFAKVHVTELGFGQELLDYCRSLAAPYQSLSLEEVQARRKGKGKDFWIDMYERRDGALDPIIEFATRKEIIDLIAAYLGEIPVFQNVEYYYSPPYTGPIKGSQLWHKDNDQSRRIKIFVSPHDITAEHGPTTAFPARLSTDRYYTGFPGYMSDEDAVLAGLSLEDAHAFVGPAGTLHFADTSRCLHYGSRSVRARSLLILDYGSVASYISPRVRKASSRRGVTDADNERILGLYR